MSDSSLRYADWKAPANDGQMLIWPEPAALSEWTRENSSRLAAAHHVRVQNVPLPRLREAAQIHIGGKPGEPLIATGHQVELYHPGVWVKDALSHTLAAKIGGRAFHFAVDTDAPKHLHLRWPGGSEAITDDESILSAASVNLLANPTPRHLNAVVRRFDEQSARWDFTPGIEPFFDALRKSALGEHGLAADMSNALHSVDWGLGLRYFELVVSPLWNSAQYLVLAHHMLATAGVFAGVYNEALDEFRRKHGIRTRARPMPDLKIGSEEIEAPFWLDDHNTGDRTRLMVRNDVTGSFIQCPGGERFMLNPDADGWAAAAGLQAFCRRNNLWLAPRAMMLTMYFRLLLSDLFIHGIGGGRYDQVTDDVIRRFFNLEPPRFAVTTATMYFPAAAGQRRVNVRPLLQEGRRLRHGMLSAEKRSMVALIDALPRGSSQRQELFFRMHQRLAAESNSPAMRQWEERLRDAEHQSMEQKALFDRELFFAIQPRGRLTGMIERYDKLFK
jgi:hypothetical protein